MKVIETLQIYLIVMKNAIYEIWKSVDMNKSTIKLFKLI